MAEPSTGVLLTINAQHEYFEDRQLARWYPLKDHAVQLALVDAVPSGILFPLVPAGRRSGKTERAKRFLVKQANAVVGQYFAAAPTMPRPRRSFGMT